MNEIKEMQLKIDLKNMILEHEAERLILVMSGKSQKQYKQLVNKQRKEFDKLVRRLK